jgi:hypothetical protein
MRKSVVYLGCVMILSVTLSTSCSKKNNTDKNTDIVTITPTVAPSIAPGVDGTVEITPTKGIKEEPKVIGEKEATKLIVDAILERGYFVGYNNDITIGENEYYEFSILNGDDIIKPNVLVNKVTGELLCLNEDNTTSPLSNHPLIASTNTGKEEEKDEALEEGKFSKEDALYKLSKVSKDILSLPVELSEYTIVYDDWNTVINGEECFGINATSKVEDRMINMGVFYVAVDGSSMYKFDVQADDFVEIK